VVEEKARQELETSAQAVYLAGISPCAPVAVVKGNLLDLQGDLWKPLTAGTILLVLLSLRLPYVKRWIMACANNPGGAPEPHDPAGRC